MTASQLLLIFRARWRSAVVVFFLVIALVVALTLALPKKYTATAAVVLDVKSPDPIAGVVLPGMVASGYMATQVDVIQSERVVLRAMRALHMEQDAERHQAWQDATDGRGDFESWMAEDIQKKLDAKPGKDSNVMLVSFVAKDARVAAATANAIVQAYIDTTLDLRTEPAKRFSSLFDESTKAQRSSLEVAQSRLSAFQQSKGIVATDEKLDIENTRLAELSTQLTVLEAVATESGNRQIEAGRHGDQLAEVVSNQTITMLAADLARQEAHLYELSQRLGSKNPQVIDLEANIKELKTRLNVERGRIAGSVSVTNTVNQGRLGTMRADLEAQRTKVLRMKGLRDEAAVLQRDVENAQREYDAGFAKRTQSNLESQTTQTNVSVLKTATPPAFPSSPRLSLNIEIGVLLGVILALAIAVVRERRDWRLRTDADVFDALRQPLLGVLPDRPLQLPSRRRSLRAVAERVLGPPTLIGH